MNDEWEPLVMLFCAKDISPRRRSASILIFRVDAPLVHTLRKIHRHPIVNSSITDHELEGYLDEAIPGERMSAIEAALRGDEALRKRLAGVIGRRDAGVHSLAEIWRSHRVTCPTRDEWGAYLMGVCAQEQEDYYQFHLQDLGCRWCTANVEDLKQRAAADSDPSQLEIRKRRERYFQSSVGHIRSHQKKLGSE